MKRALSLLNARASNRRGFLTFNGASRCDGRTVSGTNANSHLLFGSCAGALSLTFATHALDERPIHTNECFLEEELSTGDKQDDAQTEEKYDEYLDDEELSWVETDWSDLPPDNEEKETSCFICRVNREGPCRNYWRRFEKCMDANPGEDDKGNSLSAEACEKPFMAWMRCQQNHLEYYQHRANVVEHELWTDDVVGLEDERPSKPFPSKIKPGVEITAPSGVDSKSEHGPSNSRAQIIFKLESDEGAPLVMAYVKDSQGNLLGFGSLSKLSKADIPGLVEIELKYPACKKLSIHALYEGEDSPIFGFCYKVEKYT